MEDVIILALAAWALTWLLTFCTKLDGVRERLGVGFDCDANGFAIDRWAATRIGEWLNCPGCCAIIASLIVVLWWLLGLPQAPLRAFAALGITILIVRWWQGARIKPEWWV